MERVSESSSDMMLLPPHASSSKHTDVTAGRKREEGGKERGREEGGREEGREGGIEGDKESKMMRMK